MALGLANLFKSGTADADTWNTNNIYTNNGSNTSTWNTENWSDFGAKGGTVDQYGQLLDSNKNVIGSMKLNPNTSSFGTGSLFGNVGGALQGLGALANAYTGYKNYQLAKDQFGFEKTLAQTNLANQADLINEQRGKAADVGLALAGSSMSDADKQAARDKITAANVKGTI